jgi:hypothetical protein
MSTGNDDYFTAVPCTCYRYTTILRLHSEVVQTSTVSVQGDIVGIRVCDSLDSIEPWQEVSRVGRNFRATTVYGRQVDNFCNGITCHILWKNNGSKGRAWGILKAGLN